MIRPTLRYAAACAALTLAGVFICWPLLDAAARSGVLLAAGLAFPFQVATFAALVWGWERRFLITWIGGMLGRLALLGAALAIVTIWPLPAAPTLLLLASFLFAMLLIEPFFLPVRPAPAGVS